MKYQSRIKSIGFVGVTATDNDVLATDLASHGFRPRFQVCENDAVLFEAGNAHVLVNQAHTGSTTVSAIGFVVDDVQETWSQAISHGAWPVGEFQGAEFPYPAVFGPSDTVVYFVDSLSHALEHGVLSRIKGSRARGRRPVSSRVEGLFFRNATNVSDWMRFLSQELGLSVRANQVHVGDHTLSLWAVGQDIATDRLNLGTDSGIIGVGLERLHAQADIRSAMN